MSSLVPPPADKLDLPDLQPPPPSAVSAPPRTLPPDFVTTSTFQPQPVQAPPRPQYTTNFQPQPMQTRSRPQYITPSQPVQAPPRPHYTTPQSQPVQTPPRTQLPARATPQMSFTQNRFQADDDLQHFLFVFHTAAETIDAKPGTGTAYQVGHAIESLGAILPDPEVRDSFRDYASKYPLHNYLNTTADCLGWIYAALEIPVPTAESLYGAPSHLKMREDMGYPSQETVQRPIFPYIPPNLRIAGVLGTPANYRVGFNKQHARSLERLQYSAQRFRRTSRA